LAGRSAATVVEASGDPRSGACCSGAAGVATAAAQGAGVPAAIFKFRSFRNAPFNVFDFSVLFFHNLDNFWTNLDNLELFSMSSTFPVLFS